MTDTAMGPAHFAPMRIWTSGPLLIFLAVAFGVPWAGWSVMAALGLPNPWLESTVLGWALFLTAWGCSLGGFAATYADDGRAAIRALGERCLRWRVPLQWWLVALLLPSASILAAGALYGAFHGEIGAVSGDVVAWFAWPVFAAPVSGPLGEEAGWRGFLLPYLMRRVAPFTAALVIGALWGIWHAPVYLAYPDFGVQFGSLGSALFFVLYTIALSVVMTMLFLRTGCSVLLAIVFHWAVNVTPMVLGRAFPELTAQAQGVIRAYSVAISLIILIGLILWFRHELFSRPLSAGAQ